MTSTVEQNGVCYEIEYGDGCDDCWGLGAVYDHTPSCVSDFCVGSGDEHSCLGGWLPCPTCGTVRRLHPSKEPQP